MTAILKTITATMALVGSLVILDTAPAEAQNRVVQTVGAAARACVNVRACRGPAGVAIRGADRAGWAIGNQINRRQGLPQVRYPGPRRR